jgi:hypothetical protein
MPAVVLVAEAAASNHPYKIPLSPPRRLCIQDPQVPAIPQCQFACPHAPPLSPATPPLQAFVLYEEGMSDQRQRLTALYDMVGTLCQSYVYGQEHRDSLGQATTTACMKLLARGDQARGLCKAASLWWQAQRPEGVAGPASLQPAVRDGAKVRARADLRYCTCGGRHSRGTATQPLHNHCLFTLSKQDWHR